MKLYPRRLHSIEDLEHEKNMLKEMRKLNEENSPFSVSAILGGDGKSKGKKKKNDDNDEGSFLDGLSSVSPIIGIVTQLLPIFRKNKNGKATSNPIADVGNSAKKVAGKVAKDVAFGYVKWKAIELAIKGVRKFIQSRKEKQATEKA